MTVAIWFENKRVLFFKCILLTVLCHVVLHSIQLPCILLWQMLFWYKVNVKFWEEEQVLGQIIAVPLRFLKEQENY